MLDLRSVGGNALVVEGANLGLRSGAGQTHGADNGIGNLWIGYNSRAGAQGGSHNLLIGDGNSATGSGALLVGADHSALADQVALVGGAGNRAEATAAVVLAGPGLVDSTPGALFVPSSRGGAHARTSFGCGGTVMVPCRRLW